MSLTLPVSLTSLSHLKQNVHTHTPDLSSLEKSQRNMDANFLLLPNVHYGHRNSMFLGGSGMENLCLSRCFAGLQLPLAPKCITIGQG